MQTVAIIGGGFTGTMVAVNLARLTDEPIDVKLINTKRPLGRGTAYGTKRSEHLLNVAARNMSAFPDIPLHFIDWLRSRSEFDDLSEKELHETFVPRRIYGDYVRGLLASCMTPCDARGKGTIEAIDDEAIDIVLGEENETTVLLKSGDSVEADQVVLATGNQPPGSLPSAESLRYDSRYCGDPWDQWYQNLPSPGGKIVLLGTGLTMVDIVLTLGELNWEGTITAVSRNGMLPQSHFRGIFYDDFVPEDAESLGLSGLVQLVKRHCDRLQQIGQNPAIAIDKLRPYTQKFWQSLSVDEKREFLSKYAAKWNVTRHRIASSIHEKITDALDKGRLRIVAGRIEHLVPTETKIDVLLRTPDGETKAESGELVINCTGPQTRFSESRLPLFENLLQRQLVCCDFLDMGIQVDDEFAIIDGTGHPMDRVFAVGPLLKGTLWETTAVPELRVQAMRVAERILNQNASIVDETKLVEYFI